VVEWVGLVYSLFIRGKPDGSIIGILGEEGGLPARRKLVSNLSSP
jgi:hypothetical protein